MRTVLIALLLASAAGPAIAADADTRGDRSARADRGDSTLRVHQKSGDGETRSEQPRRERSSAEADRSERRARHIGGTLRNTDATADGATDRLERRARRLDARQANSPDETGERRAGRRSFDGSPSQQAETPGERAQRRASGDTVRQWRMRDRERSDSPATIEARNLRNAPAIGESRGGLVQPTRRLPGVFDPQRRRGESNRPVFGTQAPAPGTATLADARPSHRWSREWRKDGRYDWWDWRRRNRSLFHFGFYNDPFGWSYFPHRIGWRLWPSYYRSSFWLHDSWRYRLPPAYGPYRWVRYWDDALLVNIYTGEVVDVVYNFFW